MKVKQKIKDIINRMIFKNKWEVFFILGFLVSTYFSYEDSKDYFWIITFLIFFGIVFFLKHFNFVDKVSYGKLSIKLRKTIEQANITISDVADVTSESIRLNLVSLDYIDYFLNGQETDKELYEKINMFKKSIDFLHKYDKEKSSQIQNDNNKIIEYARNMLVYRIFHFMKFQIDQHKTFKTEPPEYDFIKNFGLMDKTKTIEKYKSNIHYLDKWRNNIECNNETKTKETKKAFDKYKKWIDDVINY